MERLNSHLFIDKQSFSKPFRFVAKIIDFLILFIASIKCVLQYMNFYVDNMGTSTNKTIKNLLTIKDTLHKQFKTMKRFKSKIVCHCSIDYIKLAIY